MWGEYNAEKCYKLEHIHAAVKNHGSRRASASDVATLEHSVRGWQGPNHTGEASWGSHQSEIQFAKHIITQIKKSAVSTKRPLHDRQRGGRQKRVATAAPSLNATRCDWLPSNGRKIRIYDCKCTIGRPEQITTARAMTLLATHINLSGRPSYFRSHNASGDLPSLHDCVVRGRLVGPHSHTFERTIVKWGIFLAT